MDVRKRSCVDIDAAFDTIVKTQESPDFFVLMVGTNDLIDKTYSPKEVAEYYKEMLLIRKISSFVVRPHRGLIRNSITNKRGTSRPRTDHVTICCNNNLESYRLYRKRGDGIHLDEDSGVRKRNEGDQLP